MEVQFSKTATKDLRKIPKLEARKLIVKLDNYAASGQGDVKKLQGSEFYRLRSGNYRAIFEIESNILVVRVAHRKDIYRT